jgi:SWI/SNF-related matrix-associated actin-dependent regulator of chromatin subfamily A member 5
MIIKEKVQAYDNPIDEMTLHSSTQKSKYFSKDSDILLLMLTDQIGYGKWREIKQALRRDMRSRFDHLFLSRSEIELQRRVDTLIKGIEKEESKQEKKQILPFDDIAEQMR